MKIDKMILISPPPEEGARVRELPLVSYQYRERVNDPELQDILDADISMLFNAVIVSEGFPSMYEDISRTIKSIDGSILFHKHRFSAPRPKDLARKNGIDFESDSLHSAETPSYPSGHAAQAHYAALVLSGIFPHLSSKFHAISEMVSQSRIDRGVHLPSDIKGGKDLAVAIHEIVNGDTMIRESENRKSRKKKNRLRKEAEKVNENLLRMYIREQIHTHLAPKNLDNMTPEESYGLGWQAGTSLLRKPEFAEGPDEPAGYIVVYDRHDKNMIAYAPIVRTDGPDRPFLVRTTDTKWMISHDTVKLIYPEVEDVFNFVDSKEDWNNLGPGDQGEVGIFEWEWVKYEPLTKQV